jgi:hypothetical protein
MARSRDDLNPAARRALKDHPGLFEGVLLGESLDSIARQYDLDARITLRAYLLYREQLVEEERARLALALMPETEEQAAERLALFKGQGVAPQRMMDERRHRELEARLGDEAGERPWERWMSRLALSTMLEITAGQLNYRFANWPHYHKRPATPEEMEEHGDALVCRVIGGEPHSAKSYQRQPVPRRT